ncbi:23S rRNA pseudouridine2457 synthase [Lishizhenia tianjinensis]|uniref:Pseudouridine synthase n=1 Tax=Lishizhenia tianjinensis TaxID=477690 RepID=A0A1I7AZG6_9FLAO|nr:pseudouridine synthase [Lishizhenia tianjinensis]SFT80272.1 23S rRNA pseudouridine2457 synthase [Lishizhenia tianjinensis]
MVDHQDFIMHKPVRCLSQFVQNGKRKKKLLGDYYDFPEGTMAIGRLDAETEGLLFLTTDGQLSEDVRSSKYEKEYWVQVDGSIDDAALHTLRTGVEISVEGESYLTQPAKVEVHQELTRIPKNPRKERDPKHGPMTWLKLTISEGKYRQVRKMTAAVGFPTVRLVRWRIGGVTLEGLTPGEVKVLDRNSL